jgi:hypothetical protein
LVETALKRAADNYAAVATGALLVALIAALALTGRSPGPPELHFEAHGIVLERTSAVIAAEIKTGPDCVAFRRTLSGSWVFDRDGSDVPRELASHLETALHFIHASEPARALDPDEYQGASFADFGLDPPAYVVSLKRADRSPIVVDFGTLNPSNTEQYVRLIGRPRLYLMPRHVGEEWELTADMVKRIAPPEVGSSAERSSVLLLPASIDRVWAVEIVFQGKLHRFERDGAGNWLLHVGRHTHSGNMDTHVADPVQASIIATALAAFDQTQVEALVAHNPEASELERFGLVRPMIIVLLYARDSSSPLARLEFGNVADDGFGRYARIAGNGDVVTIAAYATGRLIDLLKAVGATS